MQARAQGGSVAVQARSWPCCRPISLLRSGRAASVTSRSLSVYSLALIYSGPSEALGHWIIEYGLGNGISLGAREVYVSGPCSGLGRVPPTADFNTEEQRQLGRDEIWVLILALPLTM